MDQIYLQTKAVIEELGEKANLKAGNIVVVGCSTSEVLGAKIGTNSNPDTAKKIFENFSPQRTQFESEKSSLLDELKDKQYRYNI